MISSRHNLFRLLFPHCPFAVEFEAASRHPARTDGNLSATLDWENMKRGDDDIAVCPAIIEWLLCLLS